MEMEEKKHGLLAFFGMDTMGNTCDTMSCLMPIAGIMVLALGVISYLFSTSGLVSLSIGKYAVAIAIAVTISFFTLARLRVMNLSHDDEENDESEGKAD
jgi:hypothetical protein